VTEIVDLRLRLRTQQVSAFDNHLWVTTISAKSPTASKRTHLTRAHCFWVRPMSVINGCDDAARFTTDRSKEGTLESRFAARSTVPTADLKHS
jgi:hypothetical protein